VVAITDGAYALFTAIKIDEVFATLRAMLVLDEYAKEAGELSGQDLTDAETLRLAGSDLSEKILALSVHDGGEDFVRPGEYRQEVLVRLFDRSKGYARIRLARNELRRILSRRIIVTMDGKRGLLALEYRGRSGYQYDPDFAVDYEVLTFSAVVLDEE